ncbi:hypothetical protein NQZ68_012697 [Dissostichus eleginoides]|nr:hypothetical protein NQZ68_012697 [Dissostichus eleginoides]
MNLKSADLTTLLAAEEALSIEQQYWIQGWAVLRLLTHYFFSHDPVPNALTLDSSGTEPKIHKEEGGGEEKTTETEPQVSNICSSETVPVRNVSEPHSAAGGQAATVEGHQREEEEEEEEEEWGCYWIRAHGPWHFQHLDCALNASKCAGEGTSEKNQ